MYLKTKAGLTAIAVAALSICIQAQVQAPASRVKASKTSGVPDSKGVEKSGTQQVADRAPEPLNQAEHGTVTRVTGIGGVFIKSKNPSQLRVWYKTHLGIDVQAWGGTAFRWVDAAGVPANGTTAWQVGNGANFAPSSAGFMINYRVADLHGLLKLLREEGCQVLDQVDESEFGLFGWVMDPEGNKVELWQPPEGK